MPNSGRDGLRQPLGLAGAALATVSGSLPLAFLVASLAGSVRSPYLGMVACVAFPALAVLGLLLVGAASRLGMQALDSPAFCGSCHSVTDPEVTLHARSVHARVALQGEHSSQEAAAAGLQAALRAFYAEPPPPGGAAADHLVDSALLELTAIWERNVWPGMKITWGASPSLLGHEQAQGCIRCHDGTHATLEGRNISHPCTPCHAILARNEKDPAILRQPARRDRPAVPAARLAPPTRTP